MNINKKIYVSEVTISCACVQVDRRLHRLMLHNQSGCALCCGIFAPKVAKVHLPMTIFPSILSPLWALRTTRLFYCQSLLCVVTLARQKARGFFYALESIYDSRLIRSTIVEIHRDRSMRLQDSFNSSRIIAFFSGGEKCWNFQHLTTFIEVYANDWYYTFGHYNTLITQKRSILSYASTVTTQNK